MKIREVDKKIYLHRLTGRFHHARLDEGRKHNDRLLQ